MGPVLGPFPVPERSGSAQLPLTIGPAALSVTERNLTLSRVPERVKFLLR